MNDNNRSAKIAFVADYLPRQCGIATFTHDLRQAVAAKYPGAACRVLAINDRPESYDYPPEVRFEIREKHLRDYREASDFLRFNGFDVLCLQHEFGLYGGHAGDHVLALLREVKLPVVTTLHTILEEPSPDQRRVMDEIVRQSERLVVMTERGRRILIDTHDAPAPKIDLIAHGIPDMPFVDPDALKGQFGLSGKKVLLTFGLLSPGKGIEHVIRALPEITRRHPDLVYIVLGATHPNLLRKEGERYRLGLERLAEKSGMGQHVAFYNRFVELDELKQFIGAADIYLTPYLGRAQATSGTLCYAFGCGKAVISTSYWHAEELLADQRGVLVPFQDSAAIASAVTGLLDDPARLEAMSKRAYQLGREMIWSRTAERYARSFQKARASHRHHHAPRFAIKTLAERPVELPELSLDHVERLTDSVGIFQHAAYAMPDYAEGYCTDDNARALLLMVLLESAGPDTPTRRMLATKYAAFMQYAFDPEGRRFQNFMGFDRRWRDEPGSDDCFGRCLWVLGMCLRRSKHRSFQQWAAGLFLKALPGLTTVTSPRAWAFGLIGVQEYLEQVGGDRRVSDMSELLTTKLTDLYDRQSDADWPWFEPILTYDNAKLSHALIASARRGGSHRHRARELGLETLRWLVAEQTKAGCFVPIGSDGFYPKGGERARFDQQPIEAQSTMSACIEAFEATQDPFWRNEARRAFAWFLGRNDLDQPLYNPASGGCYDGLHFDRVNLNQGAESTLAFLLSLTEMTMLQTANVSDATDADSVDATQRRGSPRSDRRIAHMAS
jgi:glycosyltransferase involved in cell wall biosynthesis